MLMKPLKAAVKSDTPLGQRGFFHDSPLAAKRAFGPDADVVKMDDYVKDYFKDGVLINRLCWILIQPEKLQRDLLM
jgi:hypothetical protein